MSDFIRRHIGPSKDEQTQMLEDLGLSSLDELVRKVVPDSILLRGQNNLPQGCSEHQALTEIQNISKLNDVKPSLMGQGYYGTIVPPVIQRNVFENPEWYTSYTPYQAEISQGRLEALFNYQTLVTELTGLPVSNASLLDEGTAAAEAMLLAHSTSNNNTFLVDQRVFSQTLKVLETRAEPLGIQIRLLDFSNPISLVKFEDAFGILIQMPNNEGEIINPDAIIRVATVHKCMKIAVVDPMAQVLMKPVGEMGFDIAVGSMQRFGIPMGYGGPHAAFFATSDKYKRKIPGRIVGQSLDKHGNKALRLALQTREQHIRRDKATSNICTAQALLANMSGFYAAYHGADGLKTIARRIHLLRETLLRLLYWNGFEPDINDGFDTVRWKTDKIIEGYNVTYKDGFVTLSLDELSGFETLFDIMNSQKDYTAHKDTIIQAWDSIVDYEWEKVSPRSAAWLTQPVFNKYHSETDMMRYIHQLVSKDFSLVSGMVPLGSCTMKLNAVSELMPVSWEEFANVHPHTPPSQTKGYQKIIQDLESWLCNITGFDSINLQPNAGHRESMQDC